MELSLKVAKNQPGVLNNLANCYRKKSNFDSAKECYQKAIMLNPDFFDPVKNIISLFIEIGQNDLALEKLVWAREIWSTELSLENMYGQILSAQGRYDEALSVYTKLLNADVNYYTARHNMARILRVLGKSQQAIGHYELLLKSGFKSAIFFHNYGNALSDVGHISDAIDCYVKALDIDSSYVDSHINLSNLYWETNQKELMFNSYLSVFGTNNDSDELRLAYASLLFRVKNYPRLLDFLQENFERLAYSARYHDLLGKLQYKNGNFTESIISHEKAFRIEPVSEIVNNFVKVLIENEDFEKAKSHLLQFLEREPDDQLALAYLSCCWRGLGEDALEARLNQYDSFIREYELDVPLGYNSLKEFCQELAEYLKNIHTKVQQPLEQSLHRGTQTQAKLFDSQHPMILSVIEQVSKAIERYKDDCPFVGDDELGLSSCDEYQFSGSWSVRLNTGGFHNNHVHPQGWLSGCLYIELPDEVDAKDSKEGWIKFGEPLLEHTQPMEAKTFVQPKVGRVILFPSYIWHGTVPFSSQSERITIAFDIAKVI
jgi:uncharacterized protein (TIGR02466 family)